MPEKAKLIGSLYKIADKQFNFRTTKPDSGTSFITPTAQEVQKYGYTDYCDKPDWRVGRNSDQIEEKLGASPQTIVRTVINNLRLHGILIDQDNPITFFDMGSGDGTTIRELTEKFDHRKTDLLNGDNIANLTVAVGITKKIHFSLYGLLFQQILPNRKSLELSSLLSTLAILVKQKIWRANEEKSLLDEMQAFIEDVNNLPLLLRIIDQLALFEDNTNPYIVKISQRSIEDEYWPIPEDQQKFVNEIRKSSSDFFQKYFSPQFIQSIQNQTPFPHTKNLPVTPGNTIPLPFEEMEEKIPQEIPINSGISCRGSSHIKTKEGYLNFLRFCGRRAAPGMLLLEDGIIKDTTGEFQHEPLAQFESELGDDFKVHLILEPKGSLLRPKSILIERGINSANGIVFASTEDILTLSKNKVATTLENFIKC